MKVLIVEDESMAAKRLTNLLLKLEPDIEILDQLDSVKTAVKWLSNNQADLLFFDIQLADGLSFEILNQVNIQTPIIFTTAFDEYAIKAFKVNSIDYLLKPIDPEELKHALEKFHQNFRQPEPQQPNMAMLEQAMKMLTKQYKERFVVKIGEHIHTIPVNDTAYFFSQDKATFLVTEEKKRYIIDYTLEEVEGLIDPQDFFRINRKYLVSMRAVKDIVSYTTSRLRIILHQSDEMDAIVSRERVQDFKKWLDR
ncbi:LytTR family DNA-binding domain-containing protein [uncultured Roseivirga sp.]|uniref:LytR/AlgR family response regulator transcription factor n=1 Tax=uncultured Roseivirga sp. TaxID=543088 RepID=UPI000D7B81AB|nr:LytTR family DNA-binding domain-containing protein [uncultured Roseivirga sp.]PWL30650.1 MAG: DNA-binding response regulator [Roseivirga sp. XM-24bin3]